jgi:hypothetical protein
MNDFHSQLRLFVLVQVIIYLINRKSYRSVQLKYPSPGGVAQLVERVLYHSTRRAVPERSWVQSLLPSTEVEPGFSTLGGMLVPVLQLISPVCKTGTSRSTLLSHSGPIR